MTQLHIGKLPPDILQRLLDTNAPQDERLLIGPGVGRDSAALAFGDSVLVVKSDPITFPTERPALHLLHVNANDIVCQGAVPRWLLVTALLPAGLTTVRSVEALFNDLTRESAAIGVTVIGGHTEVTDAVNRPLLIGTMIGETTRSGLIDPTNARPGDRLLITKSAGIEGTALLATVLAERLSAGGWTHAEIGSAAAMLDEPGISVVKEALALAQEGIPTALHDPTEGGVASALREMAIAAGCGAVVSADALPIDPRTKRLGETLGVNPLGLLASGSLLAAVPKDRIGDAEAALSAVGVPWAWIGKLTPDSAGFRLRTGIFEGPLPEFAADEVARILSE